MEDLAKLKKRINALQKRHKGKKGESNFSPTELEEIENLRTDFIRILTDWLCMPSADMAHNIVKIL